MRVVPAPHKTIPTSAPDVIAESVTSGGPVHVHTEVDGRGRVVTTIIGEVDAHSAPTVQAHLDAVGTALGSIDIRHVTLLCAAGVHPIVAAARAAEATLLVSPLGRRVLEICDGEDLISVESPEPPPALDTAPFGVAIHDVASGYRYVNRAFASAAGIPDGGGPLRFDTSDADDPDRSRDRSATAADISNLERARLRYTIERFALPSRNESLGDGGERDPLQNRSGAVSSGQTVTLLAAPVSVPHPEYAEPRADRSSA